MNLHILTQTGTPPRQFLLNARQFLLICKYANVIR